MSKTKRLFAVTVLGAAVAAGVFAQDAIPPALQQMAETEREFARTARVKGIRDSFLDFFSEDSLAFTPEATSARARLMKQESTPFAVNELLWEPRLGDVAASGELGWLTGTSTFIDHSGKDATPHYGNYLSVWRKQPDGRWRVFIDVGTSIPSEAAFPPGLTRMPFAARYTGGDGKAAAGKSLLDADRQLNAQITADGAARAYGGVTTAATRLHRPGSGPSIGTAAVTAWLERNAAGLSATSTAAESSESGDLGYSYGKYEMRSERPESGAYVRIWSRDADGKWSVVADIVQRAPPRPPA